MKRLLLLPFSLIYNLIRVNLGKLIILSFFSLVLYGVFNVEQHEIKKLYVISHVTYNGGHLYVVKKDDVVDPSVIEYKTEQKLEKGILLHQTDTDFYRFCLVLSYIMGIIGIALLVASCIEDDVAWDFTEVFQRSISVLIECELEDGQYHYTILGRLINIQREKQYVGDTSLAYRFDINDITSILNLPKFKTKTERRNKFLDKLGV